MLLFRWRPFLAFALFLTLSPAAVLAGCGGGDETTTAVTQTVTEQQTETEEQTAGTDDAQADAGPAQFQTPSGNIGCAVSADGARCDIAKRSWEPPAPKQPCELDYGYGIGLSAGRAAFVCAGDTTLGAPATLPYGETSRRGRFSCESTEAGVGCTDSETGAGFFLSREEYDLRPPSS